MKTATNSPDEGEYGCHDSGGEARHNQLGEEKIDGTELTVPSAEGHPGDETEPAPASENIRFERPVDEPDSDGAQADPKDATAPNEAEEITVEEIMANHAAQAPSEENGFSLDEVVATEQVVPSNLAHAAGANFRKPGDKEFVRVTKSPDEILPLDILEVDDKSKYIVTPTAMAAINMMHEAKGRMMIKTKRVIVHLAVNMDGVGFLWPITVMESDNTWVESAQNCANIAKDQWIRIVSNSPAKRYDYHPANKHAGTAPKWPNETFIEMLNLAFKNKVIKSLDHPVIKELLDEE